MQTDYIHYSQIISFCYHYHYVCVFIIGIKKLQIFVFLVNITLNIVVIIRCRFSFDWNVMSEMNNKIFEPITNKVNISRHFTPSRFYAIYAELLKEIRYPVV